MADKKITDLASATTPLAGTEVVEIVQGGSNKKVAVSEFGGGGGGSQDLDDVLGVGNVALDKFIELGNTAGDYLLLEPNVLTFSNVLGGQSYIYPQASIDSIDFRLPEKPNGTETFAMLSDIEQILLSANNANLGSHTGSTADTIILNIPIPADTYEIGDWIPFIFDFTKIGTAGALTVRVRAGVTGTTGDTLIASNFITAANVDSVIARYRMRFETGNVLVGLQNTQTVPTDLVSNTSAKSSASLDPSADWILSVSVSLGNSADQVQCRGYRVGKIKTF